ncbi:sphingomyelin phosphodiesterase 2-like [Chiloscyllium plagiosum]|uniref:sphingomyelin phosphodiesterase 2-like n=1 Tax=Chiloscyllium plagiosum TaxID=36176 RepID=UPI001CB7B4EC|nr:sphingomyelin phosphodiesterase 2-like [Chiloscyllium plagiosum]
MSCGVWPCEPVAMSEASAVRFRVFTLNCWGIRYLSKCCRERYEMIALLLSQERYDVVLLQEVWSEQDYHFLRSKLTSTHPYSVYFRSGAIGSGLCVFARYIITDSFLYRYSLNGYPYKLHHGDWFGGKSVGLVILNIKDLVVHVYVTHGCEGGCTLLSQNCFASVGDTQSFPSGIRIDYILYKGSGGFPVKCEHLMTTNGTPPGRNMPYSDHEAVCATLNVQKEENAVSELRHVEEADPQLVDILNEARAELKIGIHGAEKVRYSSGRMAILGFILLLLEVVMAIIPLVTTTPENSFPKVSFYILGMVAFAVALLAGILYVFHTIEVKMLQGTEYQMSNAIQALQERLGH